MKKSGFLVDAVTVDCGVVDDAISWLVVLVRGVTAAVVSMISKITISQVDFYLNERICLPGAQDDMPMGMQAVILGSNTLGPGQFCNFIFLKKQTSFKRIV